MRKTKKGRRWSYRPHPHRVEGDCERCGADMWSVPHPYCRCLVESAAEHYHTECRSCGFSLATEHGQPLPSSMVWRFSEREKRLLAVVCDRERPLHASRAMHLVQRGRLFGFDEQMDMRTYRFRTQEENA